ncbi:hypothetical protein LEM8419_00093 [Neolewinella maritima]|uniref:HEAT repeat domain-containing protein n=1 Tax=Neolewinella maritima TaxID=1383882 RepID=A0ABN8F400_9BACT|nr:HEAT repeat domain-containing protein [Neolewinella maritima]CAH0998745.1 hypothetical protein LEM8419_00093 [Neolewinella maritima]
MNDPLDKLRRELAALPDPLPGPETDERFATMLAAEVSRHRPPSRSSHLRTAAPYLAVAASLLLVFGLGWSYAKQDTGRVAQDLAATRTLMLELMQDRSSFTRMRAVTASLELPSADPEVIEHLGHLLRTDASTNVRLAALDALRRFAASPAARREMLRAMSAAPPPAVRVQLLETLVALQERDVLPYLQDIMTNDSLPQQLRDAAELGTFKLI